MNDSPKPISIQSIDKVLRFLPIFEQSGYEFFKWGDGSFYFEDGSNVFPAPIYSADVDEFVETLYEEGFIICFDWIKWQDEAEQLFLDPNALKTAGVETLQKLLTTHIRKDRFCEGHLAGMLSEHHITAILRRLSEIRDEMADQL